MPSREHRGKDGLRQKNIYAKKRNLNIMIKLPTLTFGRLAPAVWRLALLDKEESTSRKSTEERGSLL